MSTNSYFSFMVFTPKKRNNLSFRISSWSLYSIIIITTTIITIVSITFYLTYKRQYDTAKYITLKKKIKTQSEQIDQHLSQLESLQLKLSNILEKEEEIRYLLDDNKYLRKRFKKYKKRKN